MKASHGLLPVFDDANLVSDAGLSPVLALAEKAGLSDLVTAHLAPLTANRDVKVRTILAGMLAGADCIDDLDRLRAGSTTRVLGEVRAPSTMGTFLRSFTHGHVLQLAATGRRLLAGLAEHAPGLVGDDGLVLVDMDDTIREVHGYHKQAAAYGYSKVRGLNALVITISTPTSLPVIGEFSLRRGNVRSGDHAGWWLKRALATTGRLAPGRQVLTRADSAFCNHTNVATASKAGAWFSFTIPAWPTVTRAIGQISADAWTAIRYPNAIKDPDTGALISDAEVAEIPFTAFVTRPQDEQVACRLVVRRVKRLNQNAKTGQDTLFDTYRYHAFITNSTLDTVQADKTHRQHAIIEQTIEELKTGPLAHLPSGKFTANAAWLAFAVIAHNISRAAAVAAGRPTARMLTIQHTLIGVPARLARTGRRLTLHLPERWPWQQQWARLWDATTGTGPPAPVSP